MSVTLYTQPGCGPCIAAKMWLTDRDIPFEQKNIRVDPAAADEVIALGATGTPVIVVDKPGEPDIVLFGFVESELKAALL